MLVYIGSGVANYTFNLIKALLKYAPDKFEYKIFYSSRRVPKDTHKMLTEIADLGAKVYRYPIPPWFLKIVWNKYQILPIEWLIGHIDYFHSSDFLRPPLSSRVEPITTVHDLTWKKFPEFHTQEVIEGHSRKLDLTINGKDTIICDSENTKKDLLEFYPKILETNEVTVIYPGVDERFRVMKKEEYEPTLKKYGIEPNTDFLLYVGAIEPRKNLPLTLDVFNELIRDEKHKHYKLMLVGRAGWKNEEVFRKIDSLGLKDKVKFVGYVEDEDLPAIYNGSKCLLYLSLYEGFGLPPLEALACGKQTLMYGNSSLKEVFLGEECFANESTETTQLIKILENGENCSNVNVCLDWSSYTSKFLIIINHKNE